MIKIFYWCPFLTKIATIKSVINSSKSLVKFDNKYDIYIINSSGEWTEYTSKLKQNNVKIINLFSFNFHQFLPKRGYLLSRLSLIIISVFSLLPLILILKRQKPDYFISHLNTMLTMFLSNFFKINFIIRISGYPKLHFLRNFLWKNLSKRIFAIISPTESTKKLLVEKKIFEGKKIYKIEDPVIDLDTADTLNKKITNNLLAIGRLTKQKNFSFLIKCFKEIENKYPNQFILNILGEGEERKNLESLIETLNLKKKVNLLGYKFNVKEYFENSFCFILSSLWEDPGFVLIESAINETFILSSDCPNGPKEFLEDNKGGILFESNNINKFIIQFDKMLNLNEAERYKMINFSKEKARTYSIQEHYNKLSLLIK